MDIETVVKSLEKIESSLSAFAEKADKEHAETGKVSAETAAALKKIGDDQHEMAERLHALEQKGTVAPGAEKSDESWGAQVVKSEKLSAFQSGQTPKCRIEVKSTLTGSDATVAPDRKPGIVPGAQNILTLEALLPSLPTSSNAIEFTKEASFTNNAAETSEGASKPESALTFSLVNMPVSTVAHWIKISKQLAADNAALAAYVNQRMRYGVNRKVEGQLATGDGTAPNIGGLFKSGNYTAHGYLSGDVGTTLAKLVLIRKVIGDLFNAGYAASAILLNPVDWAGIETDLLTVQAGKVPLNYTDAGVPRLWGLPVVQSVGVTSDTFLVGAFNEAATVYNRQDVVVELSDSDSDNFTKNLVTIRAERRLALAVEVPAAIRGGDLSPAAA